MKWDYFRDGQIQAESLKGDVVDVNVEGRPQALEHRLRVSGQARRDVQATLAAGEPSGGTVGGAVLEPRPAALSGRPGARGPVAGRGLRVDQLAQLRLLRSGGEFLPRLRAGVTRLAERAGTQIPRADTGPSTRRASSPNPIGHRPTAAAGGTATNLVKAAALLKEAGWNVEDGSLVHSVTGEAFHLRMLVIPPGMAASMMPICATWNVWALRRRSSRRRPPVGVPPCFPATSMAATCGSSPTSRRRTPWRAFRAPRRTTSTAPTIPISGTPAVDHLLAAVKSANTWDDYVAAIRSVRPRHAVELLSHPRHEQDQDRHRPLGPVPTGVDAGKLAREVWTRVVVVDEARAAKVAEYLGGIAWVGMSFAASC